MTILGRGAVAFGFDAAGLAGAGTACTAAGAAVALTLACVVAVFRFKAPMLTVLGAAAAVGIAWTLAG